MKRFGLVEAIRVYRGFEKGSDNQPRDEMGRWASSGSSAVAPVSGDYQKIAASDRWGRRAETPTR